MKRRWVLGVFLLVFAGCRLSGCHSSGTWMDAQIDGSIREKINELNATVISGISSGDTAALKAMFSDTLWKRMGATFAAQVRENKVSFKPASFKVRNQYYMVFKGNSTSPSTNVRRTKGNEHDYTLTFQPTTEETALTVGYFVDTPECFALTTAFGKYGNTWKLNILEIGLLKVMNRDAIDWYQKAQRDFDKGYLADASNDLLICENLLRPAGDLLHYVKEKDISDLDQRLTAAITQRYPFPMTDSLVKTKPSIFRISLYRAPEGYYPLIQYRTRLPMSDTVALSRECDAIHARLGQLFAGLDQGKRYLFFRAYTAIPGDTTHALAYKDFRRPGNVNP